MTNTVTGARGFIGRHLMPKLKGETRSIHHSQIQSYSYQSCRNFFFLSAYGNMADHTDPQKMIQANVIDLAAVMRNADYRHLIYVSSSSVSLPHLTPYARTKLAAEQLVMASETPACIIRPFSVTGRGEQKEHLIPKLIQSCMEGNEMPFVPDAVHDFIDVDDVALGLIMLANAKATGIFELGRGTGYTNAEVRCMVEKVTGRKANLKIVEQMRAYDSMDWVCRDYKAREFGWMPTKALETSISEMVEAYVA